MDKKLLRIKHFESLRWESNKIYPHFQVNKRSAQCTLCTVMKFRNRFFFFSKRLNPSLKRFNFKSYWLHVVILVIRLSCNFVLSWPVTSKKEEHYYIKIKNYDSAFGSYFQKLPIWLTLELCEYYWSLSGGYNSPLNILRAHWKGSLLVFSPHPGTSRLFH